MHVTKPGLTGHIGFPEPLICYRRYDGRYRAHQQNGCWMTWAVVAKVLIPCTNNVHEARRCFVLQLGQAKRHKCMFDEEPERLAQDVILDSSTPAGCVLIDTWCATMTSVYRRQSSKRETTPWQIHRLFGYRDVRESIDVQKKS